MSKHFFFVCFTLKHISDSIVSLWRGLNFAISVLKSLHYFCILLAYHQIVFAQNAIFCTLTSSWFFGLSGHEYILNFHFKVLLDLTVKYWLLQCWAVAPGAHTWCIHGCIVSFSRTCILWHCLNCCLNSFYDCLHDSLGHPLSISHFFHLWVYLSAAVLCESALLWQLSSSLPYQHLLSFSLPMSDCLFQTCLILLTPCMFLASM